MATWTPSLLRATGRHINIAPGGRDPDDLELDEPEVLLLELDDEPSLDLPDPVPAAPDPEPEPECVPFLSSRVLFLPVPSGEALRRVRFLALPLQMLQR